MLPPRHENIVGMKRSKAKATAGSVLETGREAGMRVAQGSPSVHKSLMSHPAIHKGSPIFFYLLPQFFFFFEM